MKEKKEKKNEANETEKKKTIVLTTTVCTYTHIFVVDVNFSCR